MPDYDRRAFLPRPAFIPARGRSLDKGDCDQGGCDGGGYEEGGAETLPAGGREGLPPTFRMRADEHYVDYITSAGSAPPEQLIAIADIDGARPVGLGDLGPLVESIASLGVIQPLLVRRRLGRYQLIAGSKRLAAAIAAGLTEVPCLLHEADDDRARQLADADNLRLEGEEGPDRHTEGQPGLPSRAAREIIDSLTTIESSLNLFLDRERPLRERVAAGLVRIESRRARWLVEAYGLLDGQLVAPPKTLSPAALIGRVLESLEEEARLAGVELLMAVDEPTGALFADERLVELALTGAARAMLGLMRAAVDSALTSRVSVDPATRALTFQFSQDLVAAPGAWLATPAGQARPDWSAGHGPSLGLAVATRVVHVYGGHVSLSPGPEGGCSITLVLPSA